MAYRVFSNSKIHRNIIILYKFAGRIPSYIKVLLSLFVRPCREKNLHKQEVGNRNEY